MGIHGQCDRVLRSHWPCIIFPFCLIQPAIRIAWIVNGLCNRGELQRVEGVDHHG